MFLIKLGYSEYNYDYDKNRKVQPKYNPPVSYTFKGCFNIYVALFLTLSQGYRWKPTLLFLYSLVTAIVVSALIIAIILVDY